MDYSEILTTVRKDLKEAYREREELDRKIAKLRQTVVTLGALCEEGGEREFLKVLGSLKEDLTTACHDAILASGTPVSPTDIRDTLEDLGFRFKSSNPLASIHSVLKRLLEQKQITRLAQIKADDSISNERKYWCGKKLPASWVLEEDLVCNKEQSKYILKKQPKS